MCVLSKENWCHRLPGILIHLLLLLLLLLHLSFLLLRGIDLLYYLIEEGEEEEEEEEQEKEGAKLHVYESMRSSLLEQERRQNVVWNID